MKNIFKLAEMPPLRLKHYQTVTLPLLPEPFKESDMYGRKYSPEFLNRVGCAVVMFPLEKMAEFAADDAKAMVEQIPEEFCSQWDESQVDEAIKKFTAVHVGNLAYLVLHCKSSKEAELAMRILEKVFLVVDEEATQIMVNSAQKYGVN